MVRTNTVMYLKSEDIQDCQRYLALLKASFIIKAVLSLTGTSANLNLYLIIPFCL